jgi:predicted Zn-dependent peptidase
MRKTAPIYKDIDSIDISLPEKILLDNEIPLYLLNAGTQDIIKITLLFRAGSLYQHAPLIAFAANAMLTDGCEGYTAVEISEISDFHGAHISCATDKDTATVTLLTLNKYLEKMLPLFENVVKRPVYLESELEIFKMRHSRQFLIEQSKNPNVAHKKFVRALFGDNHPYGYELQLSDFDGISADKLFPFYFDRYRPANCRIVVSGKVSRNDIRLINQHLGNEWPEGKIPYTVPDYTFSEPSGYRVRIEKPGSVQSSLRVGKQACNKLHPDYFGLTVASTILGGYFGSRLMQNLREDKGYTYGISSLLVSLRQAGYITVITDVGKDVSDAALQQIYKEIERLQQELVPEDELNLVRTYLLSEILRSFDGPFSQAESLIALLEYDKDNSYCEQYIHCIKTIRPEEIQRLSQQYLEIPRIYEIIVG